MCSLLAPTKLLELHQTLVWEMGEFPLLVTGGRDISFDGGGEGYGVAEYEYGCGYINGRGYGSGRGYGDGDIYGDGHGSGYGCDRIYINSLF